MIVIGSLHCTLLSSMCEREYEENGHVSESATEQAGHLLTDCMVTDLVQINWSSKALTLPGLRVPFPLVEQGIYSARGV